MASDRLDWTITKKAKWLATHKSGETLVANSKSELMSKINKFDKENF